MKAQYNYTDEIIYLALDELKKHNLIADSYILPFTGLSRREVIKKAGLAPMAALPVIPSITAPRAAEGQSSALVACFGQCSSAAECPAEYGSSRALFGTCRVGFGICGNVGGACSITGTCTAFRAGPVGVCSAGNFQPCNNIGGSCTAQGTCNGAGSNICLS